MRRRANSLPLDVLRPYLLDKPDPLAPLHWEHVFGNDHPVELEVGFGKGAFLVATSQAHPETNYLGLEIDRGLLLYVANRVAKRRLTNVRLVQADAGTFLPHSVVSGSVRTIHVYFPDPWWKRRHRKRRVFTAPFVAECARCLRIGGRLLLATDVAEYFAVMQKLVAAHGALRLIASDAELGHEGEGRAVTNFERKAGEHGRAVWRAGYERVAQAPVRE